MISIHVPAWGTTKSSKFCCIRSHNFNPRSRVGNDEVLQILLYTVAQFQSTFPRGERLLISAVILLILRISIHVPAWGTTVFCKVTWAHFIISIHVPAWGTTPSVGSSPFSMIFQSTFPRGERHIQVSDLRNNVVISIHVPAWGTTVSTVCKSGLKRNFNPRSRVGNDRTGLFYYDSTGKFQSTFPRGERQRTGNDPGRRIYISIHVPAWGTTADLA